MNNNSSNPFSTVFFLVAVFIGTGLLLYHSFELTKTNHQLAAQVAQLQDQINALTSSNSKLAGDNQGLINDKQALIVENEQLKAQLKAATDQITAFTATVSQVPAAVTAGQPAASTGTVVSASVAPVDLPGLWKIAEAALGVSFLFFCSAIFMLFYQIIRRKTALLHTHQIHRTHDPRY